VQHSAGIEDALPEQPHKPVKKTVVTDKSEILIHRVCGGLEEKFAFERFFSLSITFAESPK